jgi:hypothetical protein
MSESGQTETSARRFAMSVPSPIADLDTHSGPWVPIATRLAPVAATRVIGPLPLLLRLREKISPCLQPVGLTLELNSEDRLR